MAKIHNPQDQDGKLLINETTFEKEITRIEGILGITEVDEKSLFDMIGDNSTSIESNSELIAGNTTAINDHTAGISAHTAEISEIKATIGTVESGKNLVEMIGDNTDVIKANEDKIGKINATIGNISKDRTLVGLITDNSRAIDSHSSTINTITTTINELQSKDTELEGLIGTNTAAITELQSKDTELTNSITANTTAVESISTTINSLNDKDTELQNLVNTANESIKSINSAITALQNKDTELQNLVNTKANLDTINTAIGSLNNKDAELQELVATNANANTALKEKLDAFIKEAPVHTQSIQSDGGESINVRGIGEEIKEGGRLKSLTVYCPSGNNTTETIWLKVFKMHESGSGEHTFIGISDEALQHGQNNVLNYTFNNSDIILEKGTTYFFTFASEAQKDSVQFQSPTIDSVDCCIKVISGTNHTTGVLGSNTWSNRSKMPLYDMEFYSSLAKVGSDAKAAVEDLDVRLDSLESSFDTKFNFTTTFGNWHLLGGGRTNVASARRVKLIPTESGFIKSFTIKCRPEGNRVEPTTVATYLTVEDENGNEIARSLKALDHGIENSSGKILKFEFNSKSIIDKGATYYFVFRREDNDEEINACFVTTLTASGGATDEELFGGVLQGSATVTAQMIFEMELFTETLSDKVLTHINDTAIHIDANEREQWNAKASIIDVEEKISTAINEVKSDIETIETSINDIATNITALKPYKFNVVDSLPIVKADFSDIIIEDVFTLDDNGAANYIIPADIYKVDIISSEKTETFVIGEDKPADHILYTVDSNTLTAANSENTLSIKAYKAAADIQNIEVELILNDRAAKVITANAVSLVENVMCSADMVSHGVKINAYINKPESNIDSHIILDSICDSNTYDNSQHVCQVLRLEITV